MKRQVPALLGSVLFLTILLAGSGCDDPTDPGPCVAAGRIQGVVDIGGDASEATILATGIVDGRTIDPPFRTHPDEHGSYSLDLPAGDYIIQLNPNNNFGDRYDYSASGLGYGQIEPDTLAVNETTSPLRIDFNLGALFLKVDLSDVLDGELVEISLHKSDDPQTNEDRTYLNYGRAHVQDGRAQIQIFGVAPGDYRARINLGSQGYFSSEPYQGEQFWMPGTPDESSALQYEVLAGSITIMQCELTTEPTRIEGRISGAWLSMGLSNRPEITVAGLDSVTIVGRHVVYPSGRFSVNVHFPRPAKILVSHGGIDQWIGGPGFEEATVFNLQYGQNISDIELEQCGLRLDVVQDKSFRYSPEVQVYDSSDLSLVASFELPGSTEYVEGVPNLWPGDFLLYFTPGLYDRGSTSWRPQWFDRSQDPGPGQVVSLGNPGDIALLDVHLERGGTIAGQLEFETTEPSFYRILIAPADEYLTWGSIYYYGGSLGFLVRGLPDGDFKIGVCPISQGWDQGDPPPAGTIWYPGTTDWEGAGIVTIEEASDIEGLIIQMD